MKTQEQRVAEIMSVIRDYQSQGRKIGTFRFLKRHPVLGHVQKEVKRDLNTITESVIASAVESCEDYHIV